MKKSLRILLFVFSVSLIPVLMSAQTDETAEMPDVKGSWNLTYVSESTDMTPEAMFALEQKGSRVNGTYVTGDTEGVLRGSVSAEGELLLKQIDPVVVSIASQDDNPPYRATIEFRAALSDDGLTIEGTMIATDIESGKVVANRSFSAERK